MMGGIATDLDGRATLPGLYAVGECSCTGLHGANRLASNSLTECFVFGARAARAAAQELGPEPSELDAADIAADGPTAPSAATRRLLWENAGLERDAESLERLLRDPHPLARLIGQCALSRTESRGAHRRRDHPITDDAFDGVHVTVRRDSAPSLERWR
jgi:L-aspartate oxidase